MDLNFRAVGPSDPAMPFVLDSWVSSYLETACLQRGIDPALRMDANYVKFWLRRQVRSLLETSETVVAVMQDDPDTYVGWVCGIPGAKTVHYVYVKDAWRKGGVAARLVQHIVPEGPGRYTFMTHKHRGLQDVVDGHGWRWRLLP